MSAREIIGTIIANGGALEHFKAPSGHMGHRPTPPVIFLEIQSIFDEFSSTLEPPQRTLPRALIIMERNVVAPQGHPKKGRRDIVGALIVSRRFAHEDLGGGMFPGASRARGALTWGWEVFCRSAHEDLWGFV